MITYFLKYRNELLIGTGLICLLMALFVMVMHFQSSKKKRALIKIELSVGVLLIADAIGYTYFGKSGDLAYWMVRIANFLVYLLTLGNVYFWGEYVTMLFMETGHFEKLPKRLLAGFVIPSIGASILFVSLFTGLYYTINEANEYQRGSWYIVGFVIPFLTMLILYSFIIQYHNIIKRGIFWSILLFGILPMLGAVAQLYNSEIPWIDFASFCSAIIVFWFALIDQNEQLATAATTEIGSGLPNTYGYLYEVDQVISHGNITDYCGYYFDIVRMSHINNKYGKKVGDQVIITYAQNIRKHLDKDEILGRLGGNFFVALVKKTHTESFLDLLSDVPVEIEIYGHLETIHVAAVAGGYEINQKNIAAGQILSNTASAVSYAKNVIHKPYVFLDEKLEAEFDKIAKLEESARRGLMEEEFEPFFQPKIDSATGLLTGAEALIRWRHEGKLIPPMEFVPIMEKNGSVCELDFYNLEHVCQNIRSWIEQGLDPVCVSVNFSRKNLGNPILAEAISKVVEKYEIPKKLIQIEVTETLDEFPIEYLIGVVEALHRYGLSVAIDDFGTGSSSIGLLKNVKFDVLKIDKFFVDYRDEAEKHLLEDIIHMSHDIGLDVIAEGVEKKEQVEELKQMGCPLIQGYVYDRPLEKKVFEERLLRRTYA